MQGSQSPESFSGLIANKEGVSEMHCDSCRKKMTNSDTVNCETCWKFLEAFFFKAEKRIKELESTPPDVVEAARQTMKRFGELDGEAWRDVQAVCNWVLSHKVIDK